MASGRIKPNTVIRISEWRNRCAFSAQASYLVEEFLSGEMTPLEEDRLCKLMSDYYGEPADSAHLRILFNDPKYFRAPIHRQIILGAVLHEVVRTNPRFAGRSPLNPDGTASHEAFEVVAQGFNRNVVVQTDLADIVKLRAADNGARTLNLYYRPAGRTSHYDRIAQPTARLSAEQVAGRHNRWEALTSVNMDPDHRTHRIRDLPQDDDVAMKAFVKTELRQIKTDLRRRAAVVRSTTASLVPVVRTTAVATPVVAMTRLPERKVSLAATRQLFIQHQQVTLTKLEDAKTPLQFSPDRWKSLAAQAKRDSQETKTSSATVTYYLSPLLNPSSAPDSKAAEIKGVKVPTQIDLDAELAKKLQREFYAEFKAKDSKQVDADAKMAQALQDQENRLHRPRRR